MQKFSRGAIDLVLVLVLTVITVLIPATVKLATGRQELRSKAAECGECQFEQCLLGEDQCHSCIKNECIKAHEECSYEPGVGDVCVWVPETCYPVETLCCNYVCLSSLCVPDIGKNDSSCGGGSGICRDGYCQISSPPPDCLTRNSDCSGGGKCCDPYVCRQNICQIPDCNNSCAGIECGKTNECGALCTGGSGCTKPPPPPPDVCKPNGSSCGQNSDCCSGFCDPNIGMVCNNPSPACPTSCPNGCQSGTATCRPYCNKTCPDNLCLADENGGSCYPVPPPAVNKLDCSAFPCEGPQPDESWECLPNQQKEKCTWQQKTDVSGYKCPGNDCDKCGCNNFWGLGCQVECDKNGPGYACCPNKDFVSGPSVACGLAGKICTAGESDIDTGCVNGVRTIKKNCVDGCWQTYDQFRCDGKQITAVNVTDQSYLNSLVNFLAPQGCESLFQEGDEAYKACLVKEKDRLSKFISDQSTVASRYCAGIYHSTEEYNGCYQEKLGNLINGLFGSSLPIEINPVTGKVNYTAETLRVLTCGTTRTGVGMTADGYIYCATGEKAPADDPLVLELEKIKTELAKIPVLCDEDMGLSTRACQQYFVQKVQNGYLIDLNAKSAVLDPKFIQCADNQTYIKYLSDSNFYNCDKGRVIANAGELVVLETERFIKSNCDGARGIQMLPDGNYFNCTLGEMATRSQLQERAEQYCRDSLQMKPEDIVNCATSVLNGHSGVKIDFVAKTRAPTGEFCDGGNLRIYYNDGSSVVETPPPGKKCAGNIFLDTAVADTLKTECVNLDSRSAAACVLAKKRQDTDFRLNEFINEIAFTSNQWQKEYLVKTLKEFGFTAQNLSSGAYQTLIDYGVLKAGDYSLIISPQETVQVYNGDALISDLTLEFFPGPDKYSAKDGFADWEKVMLSKVSGGTHYDLNTPVNTTSRNEICVAYLGINCDGTPWEVPLLRELPVVVSTGQGLDATLATFNQGDLVYDLSRGAEKFLRQTGNIWGGIIGDVLAGKIGLPDFSIGRQRADKISITNEPMVWSVVGAYNTVRGLVVGVGTFPAQFVMSSLMTKEYLDLNASKWHLAVNQMPDNCARVYPNSESNDFYYSDGSCQKQYENYAFEAEKTLKQTNENFKMTTEMAKKMAMANTTVYVSELGREVSYKELIYYPTLFRDYFNPAAIALKIEEASINPQNALKGGLQALAGAVMLWQSAGIGATRVAAVGTAEKGLAAGIRDYFVGMPSRFTRTFFSKTTQTFVVAEGVLEITRGQAVCGNLQSTYGIGCGETLKIAALPEDLKRQYEFAIEASSLGAGVQKGLTTAYQWAEFSALWGPIVHNVQKIATKPVGVVSQFIKSRTAIVERGPWTELKVAKSEYERIKLKVESTRGAAIGNVGSAGMVDRAADTILRRELTGVFGRAPTEIEFNNWKAKLGVPIKNQVAARPQEKPLALPAPKTEVKSSQPVEVIPQTKIVLEPITLSDKNVTSVLRNGTVINGAKIGEGDVVTIRNSSGTRTLVIDAKTNFPVSILDSVSVTRNGAVVLPDIPLNGQQLQVPVLAYAGSGLVPQSVKAAVVSLIQKVNPNLAARMATVDLASARSAVGKAAGNLRNLFSPASVPETKLPECVTGDTQLSIISNNSNNSHNSHNSNMPMTKQIIDVKEGEQVLTYDEKTQKFIYSTVEKLLEKGVQQVFELETISGKKIRTTEEHPYLVLITTKKSAHADLVNQIGPPDGWFDNLAGNLTSKSDFVKSESVDMDSPGVEPGRFGLSNHPSEPAEPMSGILSQVKNNFSIDSNWVKVKYLKPGQEIMTVDGWEEIKSITKFGREPVFDIQIANTHNFVGNGIVAHNTTALPPADSGQPSAGKKSPNWRGRILEILGWGLLINTACQNDNLPFDLCKAVGLGQKTIAGGPDQNIIDTVNRIPYNQIGLKLNNRPNVGVGDANYADLVDALTSDLSFNAKSVRFSSMPVPNPSSDWWTDFESDWNDRLIKLIKKTRDQKITSTVVLATPKLPDKAKWRQFIRDKIINADPNTVPDAIQFENEVGARETGIGAYLQIDDLTLLRDYPELLTELYKGIQEFNSKNNRQVDLIIPSLDYYFYFQKDGPVKFYEALKFAGIDFSDPRLKIDVNEFIRADPSKTITTFEKYKWFLQHANIASRPNFVMTETWFGCDQSNELIQQNIDYLQNYGVQSIYLHPVSWGNWNSCTTGPAQQNAMGNIPSLP